ncbi:MAG: DUF503 domain-containing protein [Sumerlaeia bacterium]
MHVLLVEYDLFIPAAQSLKDKRSVIKSIEHRIRSSYNVSLAEVDYLDKWQRATLATAAVGLLRDRLEEIERAVSREFEERFDLEITDRRLEWL